MRDRRATVFFLFAVVSLVLVLPCPTRFHYVGVALAIVYAALGAASWLDSRSRTRSGPRD